jgi:hypothetical protein
LSRSKNACAALKRASKETKSSPWVTESAAITFPSG